MTRKIKLGILIALIVAFSIFFLALFLYQHNINLLTWKSQDIDHLTPEEFYSQHFPLNEKRVFIIGSSQVIPLNATYITNYLLLYNQDYHVYNLAEISDTPSNRLKTIDMIISAKPKIVVYGISDRDFTQPLIIEPTNPLPDPHRLLAEFFSWFPKSLNFGITFSDSPSRITIVAIDDFINTIKGGSGPISYPNTPFVKVYKDSTILRSDFQPRKTGFDIINPPQTNGNEIALKEIINRLHANKIKVLIFVIPQNKFYSDPMPTSYKDSFNLILKDLSTVPDLKIYDLYYKYKDMNIWTDFTHIVISKNGIIYSDDVSKMILNEIES